MDINYSFLFQIKEGTGLKAFLSQNLSSLRKINLSVTGISGEIFKDNQIPALKEIYLDFCHNLKTLEGLTNLPRLKHLSLYHSPHTPSGTNTIYDQDFKGIDFLELQLLLKKNIKWQKNRLITNTVYSLVQINESKV